MDRTRVVASGALIFSAIFINRTFFRKDRVNNPQQTYGTQLLNSLSTNKIDTLGPIFKPSYKRAVTYIVFRQATDNTASVLQAKGEEQHVGYIQEAAIANGLDLQKLESNPNFLISTRSYSEIDKFGKYVVISVLEIFGPRLPEINSATWVPVDTFGIESKTATKIIVNKLRGSESKYRFNPHPQRSF